MGYLLSNLYSNMWRFYCVFRLDHFDYIDYIDTIIGAYSNNNMSYGKYVSRWLIHQCIGCLHLHQDIIIIQLNICQSCDVLQSQFVWVLNIIPLLSSSIQFGCCIMVLKASVVFDCCGLIWIDVLFILKRWLSIFHSINRRAMPIIFPPLIKQFPVSQPYKVVILFEISRCFQRYW